MTLSSIHTFVRDHLDLTADDLSDAVLNVFVREGFTRAVRGQHRWPFYDKRYALTTAQGVQRYNIAATIGDLEEIQNVQGPRYRMDRVDHDVAENTFDVDPQLRRPDFYSVYGDELYMWPTPDAAYTLQIRGYRKPTDWVAGGASAVPDCPADFHEPIAFWALSRAYALQDDLANAQTYQANFAEEIAILTKRYIHTQLDRRIVMNGQRNLRPGLPARLQYPFENR